MQRGGAWTSCASSSGPSSSTASTRSSSSTGSVASEIRRIVDIQLEHLARAPRAARARARGQRRGQGLPRPRSAGIRSSARARSSARSSAPRGRARAAACSPASSCPATRSGSIARAASSPSSASPAPTNGEPAQRCSGRWRRPEPRRLRLRAADASARCRSPPLGDRSESIQAELAGTRPARVPVAAAPAMAATLPGVLSRASGRRAAGYARASRTRSRLRRRTSASSVGEPGQASGSGSLTAATTTARSAGATENTSAGRAGRGSAARRARRSTPVDPELVMALGLDPAQELERDVKLVAGCQRGLRREPRAASRMRLIAPAETRLRRLGQRQRRRMPAGRAHGDSP